jgi:hypothetical protein
MLEIQLCHHVLWLLSGQMLDLQGLKAQLEIWVGKLYQSCKNRLSERTILVIAVYIAFPTLSATSLPTPGSLLQERRLLLLIGHDLAPPPHWP